MINCFGCQQEITFSDEVRSKSGKKIPLNTDGTRHDCPARKQQEKNDHGNELSVAVPEQYPSVSTSERVQKQSKLKIFHAPNSDLVEIQYNEFLKTNNGKIKVQGGQFQMSDKEYGIALYYEETK